MKRSNLVLFVSALLVLITIAAAVGDKKEDGAREGFQPAIRAYELIQENYYDRDALDRKKLLEAAIAGMLEELPDEYNKLYDKEEYDRYQKELKGNYIGIGLEIAKRDDSIKVVAKFPGSPADKAGMEAGDVLLGIDGESTEGMSVSEASSAIDGEAGSKVTLKVQSSDGAEREITLTREEIKIPPVELKYVEDGNIALLDINLFSKETPDDLERELKQIVSRTDMAGYVIDLRNNTGGLLNSAISVASKFVDSGLVTELVGPKGKYREYDSSGNSVPNLPVAVLINEGTASASELVAAAVRGHDMGVLVGRNTFGKGLVQTTHPIGSGFKLKVSSYQYLTPEGGNIPEDGLKPDLKSDDPTRDLDLAINWVLEHEGERTPLAGNDQYEP